jgi:hypothetical protein
MTATESPNPPGANDKRLAHDAFVRWQEVSRKHLGDTINLVLGLTTGSLVYAVNLLANKDVALTTTGQVLVLLSLGCLGMATGFRIARLLG